MLLSTPTCTYLDRFTFDEMIDIVSEAGFDALDFTFCTEDGKPFVSKDLDREKRISMFREFKEKALEKGIVFNQIHAPSPTTLADEEKTAERFNEMVRGIENAAALGAKIMVAHPCAHIPYEVGNNKEKLFEINMEVFGRLMPYCEEYGVKIAIENAYRHMNRKYARITHSACGDPNEMVKYIETMNSEFFVGCLDTGHAMLIDEDPADFIKILGRDKLQALHIHDVDGFDDIHTLPFVGIGDWEKIINALREIDYQGDFTFETNSFIVNMPKELVPAASKMLVETGRYFIKQITK